MQAGSRGSRVRPERCAPPSSGPACACNDGEWAQAGGGVTEGVHMQACTSALGAALQRAFQFCADERVLGAGKGGGGAPRGTSAPHSQEINPPRSTPRDQTPEKHKLPVTPLPSTSLTYPNTTHLPDHPRELPHPPKYHTDAPRSLEPPTHPSTPFATHPKAPHTRPTHPKAPHARLTYRKTPYASHAPQSNTRAPHKPLTTARAPHVPQTTARAPHTPQTTTRAPHEPQTTACAPHEPQTTAHAPHVPQSHPPLHRRFGMSTRWRSPRVR